MRPGEIVADRFVLERLAGTGGMGAVYRATDTRTNRPVALKTLLGRENVEAIARFVRESQALARLSHPAIVSYVAHGRTRSGEMFLAMEWLEGESLGDRLKRTGLTIEQSLAVARSVAEALGVAHRQGVVHRDVKPGNIFLVDGDVGAIKLLDFGLVRLRGSLGDITLSGTMLGTAGYMAPEQARGEKTIDARVDVYALGGVLFRCITGRTVFTGDLMAMLVKVVIDDPPRLSDVRDDVPVELDSLVARLLAKLPDERPEDGNAVVRELVALGALDGPKAHPHAEPAALTMNERRFVCVLLAGAPAGVEPRGGAREDALRAALARHGGRLEALANGALLVTLDSRGSPADDAARAARCALAMRGVLKEAPIALVAGRAELMGDVPIGEAIDRGVELLGRATPGGPPLLNRVVSGFLEGRFELRAAGDAHELLAEQEIGGGTRTLLGRSTTCVGRERDLATLHGLFEECVGDPIARVALVTAPAGFGKSRVRYEFVRSLRASGADAEVWVGRGDPMSAGSPFDLIAAPIRGAAGMHAGEPLAIRREKLFTRVWRAMPTEDAQRVCEFLGEIAGVPFPDDDSIELRAARQDPQLMGDQMRRAWEDWLAAESARRPVVLVLEDLHWGDLASVKLVDAALRHLVDRPFMVLALARPDVHDLFPKLWENRDVAEIRLGRLTKKHATKLVRDALGSTLSTEVVDRMIERAGGNAFFLEELVRAVADGKDDELPSTVLAMVQTRLEGLDVEARLLLRAASVFGKAFWRGGVLSLLGGADNTTLRGDPFHELVEKEFVTVRPESRFPGEEELGFHHALVHEAAYAMLTEADRTLGHRLAAEWLFAHGERNAVALAEHFERGGEPEHAIDWYQQAATHAVEGNDLGGAIALAEKGLACGAAGEARGALELILAESHRWRAEAAQAVPHGRAALATLERGSARWYTAVAEVAEASGKVGQADLLAPLVDELCELEEAADELWAVAAVRVAMPLLFAGNLELADRLLAIVARVEPRIAASNPAALARVHEGQGTRELYRGDPGAYLRRATAAAKCFEAAGNLRSACVQRVNVGCVSVEIGAFEQAADALRGSLVAAERMGLSAVAAAARNNLGLALGRLGRLDEARQIEREAIAAAVAQRDRRLEAGSRTYLAHILVARGDLEGAAREAEAAVELLAVAPPLKAPALAVLGYVRLAQGRVDEGLTAAKDAMDLLETLGGLEEGESFVRLVHADALHTSGDIDGARRAIDAARARLLDRAAKISDPSARETFLERVSENARTLTLAEEWSAPAAS